MKNLIFDMDLSGTGKFLHLNKIEKRSKGHYITPFSIKHNINYSLILDAHFLPDLISC